jgi:hypothetical protein
LDDFLSENPFLSPIPLGRLYENIDPAKPYMLEDPIRRAVWSGSLAPYIANKVQMSLSHILTKENVGVHKDFGLVVFKDVAKKREGISDSSENYQHYSSFLTETIQRLHGFESLNALPVEMDIYLKDLTDPNVKEDDIVDHPIALPGRVFGDVSVEAYRLLRKQYPVVKNGKEILAHRIIEAVGAKFKDALTVSLDSGLLPKFLPLKWQNIYPANKYPWIPKPQLIISQKEAGEIVIEIHRHGYVHLVEVGVDAIVTSNFPGFSGDKFTRMEVLALIRRIFPEYLNTIFKEFKMDNLYEDLQIRERNPIPSLYSAQGDGVYAEVIVMFIGF